MKKPPDLCNINKFETPDWFDINFSNSIHFPNINDNKYIISSIINSEKFLLNNDFNNFSFVNNIKIFDINKHNESYQNKINSINTNPKFDIKKKNTKLKKLKTKHNKFIKFQHSVSKTINIEVKFNNTQRKIIFNWFKVCNKVYNFCVNDYNKNKIFWLSNNLNFMSYKIDVFDSLFRDEKKGCPFDILTDEIRVFCSNIKSCETNLANKNIYKYTVRKRTNEIKNIKSILIPSKSININGIFSNLLKKNNKKILSKFINFDEFDNIQDSRLIYIPQYNKFILKLVRKVQKINIDNRKEFISLDPGERIFNSYFASDSYGFFGKDLHKIYLNIRSKISRWQRILKQNKNKKNNNIKNKKRIKKRIQNLYNKIKNITKEMHNKLALYLCKNYKQILLPEFKVSKMVDDKKRFVKRTIKELKQNNIDENKRKELLEKLKLNKKENRLCRKVKFVLLSQSHYKFKKHLINKCDEYGCNLEIVTEEFTSITCSKCGSCSKIYKERIKECTCNMKIHRDINGAINILHKNHETILRRNVKVRKHYRG
jgi:transposase